MARRNPDDFKYMTIYNHFRNLISSGELPVGAKLPTEDQIIRQFHVSRITVVRGLLRLQQERFINRVQGSGSFVRSRLASESRMKVVSLIASFRGEGREGRLISGIESRLTERGYMLSVANSHENEETERDLILSIKERIQGVILYASSSVGNLPLFESLLVANFPIVFVDRYPLSLPCSSVCCDNFDGGYQIGRFLVEKGYEHIAFVYHSLSGLSSERDRYNGFMQALSEGGVPRSAISALSVNGDDTLEAAGRVLDGFCESRKGAPAAIFAVNDHLAMGLWRFLRSHGDSFSKDILLAGFDDLVGDRVGIPFITIRQEYASIGRMAAEMLIGRIEKGTYDQNNLVLPVTLVQYNTR